jgi:soluble lytic murein transglycosylase-like protein
LTAFRSVFTLYGPIMPADWMTPSPAKVVGLQISPSLYRPDLYRRCAELLVDGGFLTRREVELALREARRARQPLVQWLIRNDRVPSRYLAAVRRLETLLSQRASGMRLAELLHDSGEITRQEFRRAVELRSSSGETLGEILVREGWPGRKRKPPRRSIATPLAAAATLATLSFSAWALSQQQVRVVPEPLTAQASQEMKALMPAAHEVDLRFASLGNIQPHLQRLRQRPGPYRKPPALTGSIRQRAKKLRPLVNEYARKYSLPPALILAVIEQESSFDPMARSSQQAIGLMQLVPHEAGTAAYHFSERRPGTPTLQELQDPKTNIRLGSAYLRLLLDSHFDDIKNEDVRVALALAAYNWGPTRLRRVLRQTGLPATLDEVESLLEKHAPVETRDYVREITDRMQAYG